MKRPLSRADKKYSPNVNGNIKKLATKNVAKYRPSKVFARPSVMTDNIKQLTDLTITNKQPSAPIRVLKLEPLLHAPEMKSEESLAGTLSNSNSRRNPSQNSQRRLKPTRKQNNHLDELIRTPTQQFKRCF